jgi:hypothetical protein
MHTAPVVDRLNVVIDLSLRGRDIAVLPSFSILFMSLPRARARTIASVVVANDIHLEGLGEEDVVVVHSSAICGIAMTEDDCELCPREREKEKSEMRFCFGLNSMNMDPLGVVQRMDLREELDGIVTSGFVLTDFV